MAGEGEPSTLLPALLQPRAHPGSGPAISVPQGSGKMALSHFGMGGQVTDTLKDTVSCNFQSTHVDIHIVLPFQNGWASANLASWK